MRSIFRKKLPLLCYLTVATSSLASSPPVGFESGEHMAAGQEVRLQFTLNTPGQLDYPLHMPNGLVLNYGELVSLGDFYQLPDQIISIQPTPEQRTALFIAAFNSFARSTAAIDEAPKILAIAHAEQKTIEDAIQHGEKPEVIYSQIADENDRQWNCVTGGGCGSAWWLSPGRYLKLASEDLDHFGENAVIAYQTGHQAAIETAIAAHQTHDVKTLELAYAMNGFACHFLSDRFAAGHMRTPRAELPTIVTPSVVGTLLVGFMHKEENKYGLHVHNQAGDHWMAYGDRSYFNTANNQNRLLLNKALQLSANQVFSAYETGVAPQENAVEKLIPQPDEMNDQTSIDIASLFYWDATTHTMYRREDVASVYNYKWTSSWWGWSTLILLSQQVKLAPVEQAQLALAGYGKIGMSNGVISNPSIIQYINHQK